MPTNLYGPNDNFEGRIVFDATKPDGTPRKLLNVSRLAAAGWQCRTSLRDGIALAYRSYLAKPAFVA